MPKSILARRVSGLISIALVGVSLVLTSIAVFTSAPIYSLTDTKRELHYGLITFDSEILESGNVSSPVRSVYSLGDFPCSELGELLITTKALAVASVGVMAAGFLMVILVTFADEVPTLLPLLAGPTASASLRTTVVTAAFLAYEVAAVLGITMCVNIQSGYTTEFNDTPEDIVQCGPRLSLLWTKSSASTAMMYATSFEAAGGFWFVLITWLNRRAANKSDYNEIMSSSSLRTQASLQI